MLPAKFLVGYLSHVRTHTHTTILHNTQCTINGVNYDKLQLGGGVKVKKLEIFFFGFPRVVSMHHFPNLSVLCVMNQKISKISGLQSCVNLKELWICEGAVEVFFLSS